MRNTAEARHINIAHGIYPREPMDSLELDALAAYLRTSVSTASGRTYAGGLTKFEPREMERLVVPDLPLLRERSTPPESSSDVGVGPATGVRAAAGPRPLPAGREPRCRSAGRWRCANR